MITCANCSNEALYTYQITSTYQVHYCQYHLPRFLTNKKNAGQLPLMTPIQVAEEPKSSKKKSAPVVEEEPVVTEVVEDATNS